MSCDDDKLKTLVIYKENIVLKIGAIKKEIDTLDVRLNKVKVSNELVGTYIKKNEEYEQLIRKLHTLETQISKYMK